MSKRIPTCPSCSRPGVRCDRYDAYGCNHCGEWLESPCKDPACDRCQSRPAKPPNSIVRYRGVIVDST